MKAEVKEKDMRNERITVLWQDTHDKCAQADRLHLQCAEQVNALVEPPLKSAPSCS